MFNPERLSLARQRRRLTKAALASLVDLTPRRIADYENSGVVPPTPTLERISAAVEFPAAFFSQEGTPQPAVGSVSFRAFSRMSALDRDAALAVATLAAILAGWIDARFEVPSPDLPELGDLDAGTAADALRSAWSLGEAPAPNLIHLLEARGVRVFSLPEDCATLDALSMWIEGLPFVCLSQRKTPERSRWDAAHELGHLVLHLEAPRGRIQELEADQFASELLLPRHGVMRSAARNQSLRSVLMEKQEWRVSALAYIRRLFTLGLVSEWQYRSLVIEATQAGYRRREGDIERERSQVLPQVLAFLSQDGIRLRSIADELSLPRHDVRELLFGALDLVRGSGEAPNSYPRPTLRVV